MANAEPGRSVALKELDGGREFRLGEVLVNPGSGQISGPGGAFKLDPRVMDVLVCLASGQGAIVSRDTLMHQVWGGVIVTDFALSRCIYQLRKGLSQAAASDDSPIETLPKRGYRIAWPVASFGHARIAAGAKKRMIAMIAAILVAVVAGLAMLVPSQLQSPRGGPSATGRATDIRLVVFPLMDLTSRKDQADFAQGLSQELIHELVGLPGLVVIGRTTAFADAGSDAKPLELARNLDADYMLGGSVQSVGNSRRVIVELSSVPAGEQLSSQSYVLAPDDPFVFSRAVAQQVAGIFKFSVDPNQMQGSTENLKAFELYLAADRTRDHDAKRRLLNRALELDPGFARAWNSLAYLEMLSAWNGEERPEEAWAKAQPLIGKALAIEPAMPDALVTEAAFMRVLGRPEDAVGYLEEALKVDPGHHWANAFLGMVLRDMGRYREALAVHEAAVAMDSMAPDNRARLGTSYWFLEKHEEADRQYRIATQLNPLYVEPYDSRAAMQALGLGRFDLALLTTRDKMKLEPTPTPRTLVAAGVWANGLGLRETAEDYWRRAGMDARDFSNPAPFTSMAMNALDDGDEDAAREFANRALEADPREIPAHVLLAALDFEAATPERVLERTQVAFPEMFGDTISLANHREVEPALLAALALAHNGRPERAGELLQAVVDALPEPRSPEHLWLAAAQAMRGDAESALAELQASPPGWVRINARLLPRDPRFARLSDLPEFKALVAAHLDALAEQVKSIPD